MVSDKVEREENFMQSRSSITRNVIIVLKNFLTPPYQDKTRLFSHVLKYQDIDYFVWERSMTVVVEILDLLPRITCQASRLLERRSNCFQASYSTAQ